MQIGVHRSNIYTSVANSSLENKGILSNWYVNVKNADGIVINDSWAGTDYDGNYAQDGNGTGAVWAADALNDSSLNATMYASNVVFQSSTNTFNEYMTFNTSSPQTGNTNPRATTVTTNVFAQNVNYSNITGVNNLLNFAVEGMTPLTSSNDSVITLTNVLNPFTSGDFNGYPSIAAVADTDNTPTTPWNFTKVGGVVTPPGNPPTTSNLVVNDVYRQYLPSLLERGGRLDSMDFFYGASRYAPPVSTASYKYGVFRGEGMLQRKLTLASFSAPGTETNAGNHIEVYKYFSNVSNTYGSDRGWYDEVVLSFGENTTSSGTKEIINIRPGFGTDAVSNSLVTSNATQPNDKITITFSNYNENTLAVTANVVYESSAVTRTVSSEKTISLSAEYFNMLSDPRTKTGNVTVTSTFNSGIVSSNVDYGSRPISGVGGEFSSNLLGTCLSSFRNTANVAQTQENVYESVFPVNINMNRYQPNGVYTNKVGRAIIDKVQFQIGSQEIQSLDDLWYIMNDEVFRTQDEKDSLKYLINGGVDYLPTSSKNFGPIDLYIPLDLFFCRTQKTTATRVDHTRVYDDRKSTNPYLPLCALHNQDITVSITFNQQQYFSNTSAAIDLSYTNTFLVTEEIMISQDERRYLMETPQTCLIQNVHKLPKQVFQFADSEQRYEGIVSSFPLKDAPLAV